MTWVVAARCDVQKCDQNATISAGGDNGFNECKTQRFEFDWHSFVYLNLELTSAVAKKSKSVV